MVGLELSDVVSDPDADEGVVGVLEEVDERLGDAVGVKELEDEAAMADAELKDRDLVVEAGVAGAPLGVEADDEVAEAAAVDALGVVDPLVDEEGNVGDEGLDGVGVDSDVEDVVGVAGNLAIFDGDFHGGFEEERNRESLESKIGSTEGGRESEKWKKKEANETKRKRRERTWVCDF